MEKNQVIIAFIVLVGAVAALLVLQIGTSPQGGPAKPIPTTMPGGTGTTGTAGSSGTTGSTGSTGSTGTTGSTSNSSPNGSTGTIVTPPVIDKTPFGVKVGQAANARWGRNGIIYPATNEVADEGWFRNSFNLPGDIKIDSLCAIFMQGNATRQLPDGTTFIDRPAVNVSGHELCEMEVSGGAVAKCGGLTLNMDLEAMKAGYIKAEDNWKDFFSCRNGANSTFCTAECDTMLETLMYQKRSPMVNGSS